MGSNQSSAGITDRVRSWVDEWIFETFELSREGFADYRFLFAAYLFVVLRIAKPYFTELPDDLYMPPVEHMMLLSGFPPEWIIDGLNDL
jgi:hypothetical protein